MAPKEPEAEHQGIVAVPLDKDALGLVETIIELIRHADGKSYWVLAGNLSIIQDNATRLKVLLEEREAATEEMVAALEDAHTLFGRIMDAGVPNAAFVSAQEGYAATRAAVEAAS